MCVPQPTCGLIITIIGSNRVFIFKKDKILYKEPFCIRVVLNRMYGNVDFSYDDISYVKIIHYALFDLAF